MRGEKPDGAAAQHRHIAAALIVVAEKAVQGDGCRFKHRGNFKRDGGVKPDGICFRQDNVFGKRARVMRADKTVMPAERIVAAPAVRALHTGQQRRAGNPVADLDFCNALADFGHFPRKLMPEDNRVVVGAAGEYARDVRSADADRADAHFDAPGADFGLRHLGVTDIFVCKQYRRFHFATAFPAQPHTAMRSFTSSVTFFIPSAPYFLGS